MADVSVINFGDGGGNRNIKDVNAARSSAIAPIEDGSISSAAYSVGDYICRNGQLYKVTTAIAIGDIIGNNIQETKVSNEFGSGDDNILSKTRYTVAATNWSNSTDADGYYTYTLTLNPTLSMSYAPNVDIAGANDNTFSTDTEKEAYDLLDECKLTSESTLVLYAKTKPEVTFYIWVESKASSSGDKGGVAESIIGPVENSTTASKAYAVGEHFIRNDKFCTAIAAIASGATLTLNTNYVEGTIAEVLNGASGGGTITYHELTVTKSDFSQITDGYRCLLQMTNAQKTAWLASNKATFVFVYNGTVSYYAIGNLISPIITTKAMTQVSGLQKYSAFGLHSSMKSFDLLVEPNQTVFDIVLTTSGYSSLPNEPFKVLMAFES